MKVKIWYMCKILKDMMLLLEGIFTVLRGVGAL